MIGAGRASKVRKASISVQLEAQYSNNRLDLCCPGLPCESVGNRLFAEQALPLDTLFLGSQSFPQAPMGLQELHLCRREAQHIKSNLSKLRGLLLNTAYSMLRNRLVTSLQMHRQHTRSMLPTCVHNARRVCFEQILT